MDSTRLSRREVLRWFAAASAAAAVGGVGGAGDTALAESPASPAAPRPPVAGYGSDPDLMKIYQPGDVWPLTMTPAQRKAATALADVILPADAIGPAASAVRVPEMIDEWVSAPYPQQQADRPTILNGLDWIDAEAQKRFSAPFSAITLDQQKAICDDICWPPDAKPEFKKAASFFSAFRGRALGAYYATTEGWKAIGYVGNAPSVTFDGPPKEVLDRLGVTQTVS